MKLSILFRLSFFLVFYSSFSQDYLKEITETYENGQPVFIDYLDISDLKKVKTDMFDENGKRIFSMSFNKENGLPDGEFFDLINKGYFKNGVLFCDNCLLVENNTPSVFTFNFNKQDTHITRGNIVDGKFRGKIERYAFYEHTYRKIDWESTREKIIVYGMPIWYRDVKQYSTGRFYKTPSEFFFYNDNGNLEGDYLKNNEDFNIQVKILDGKISTYVVKDKKGIVVDSLSNQNDIWKIKYKFVRNNGFLTFKDFENIYGPSLNRDLENRDYEVNPYITGSKILEIRRDIINNLSFKFLMNTFKKLYPVERIDDWEYIFRTNPRFLQKMTLSNDEETIGVFEVYFYGEKLLDFEIKCYPSPPIKGDLNKVLHENIPRYKLLFDSLKSKVLYDHYDIPYEWINNQINNVEPFEESFSKEYPVDKYGNLSKEFVELWKSKEFTSDSPKQKVSDDNQTAEQPINKSNIDIEDIESIIGKLEDSDDGGYYKRRLKQLNKGKDYSIINYKGGAETLKGKRYFIRVFSFTKESDLTRYFDYQKIILPPSSGYNYLIDNKNLRLFRLKPWND